MSSQKATRTAPAPAAGLLQRSCEGGCGGSCEGCAKKKLQRSATGDVGREVAPPNVHAVLRSPGAPLAKPVRREMEEAFGHDFSGIRVHADGAAARSAESVGARAYTVGSHIAFTSGAYAPDTATGRRLLAHELAHTVQQRGARAELAPSLEIGAANTPAEAEADAAANAVVSGRWPAIGRGAAMLARQEQQGQGQGGGTRGGGGGTTAPPRPPMCSRTSHVRVAGFTGAATGAHISEINVEIHPNTYTDVNLTWANLPSGTSVPANPLQASPGAGNCNVDCSDAAASNRNGSHCTPIGDFQIQGHQCVLNPREPTATRVSWFMRARGIAFHNYHSVPDHPESHGCVRMALVGSTGVGGADWIHDNTITGVTNVHVHRAAGDPGPKCYTGRRLGDRPGYTAPQPTQPSAPPAAPPPAQSTGGGGGRDAAPGDADEGVEGP